LIVRLFRSNEHRSEEAIHQAVSAIRDSGATEAALDEARGFVQRSRLALDQLPAAQRVRPCKTWRFHDPTPDVTRPGSIVEY